MTGLTVSDPVSFREALASPRVIPGDVLLLLPGDYIASTAGTISGSNTAGKGVFRVLLQGTQMNPITIKAQIAGTVNIIGGIELINSPYIILEGLHIEPTITDRFTPDYPHAVYCSSIGCKLIHNTIIGGKEGVSWFGVGESEIYGNYISGAGWNDGVSGRGTSLYTHNHNGGKVTIQHNIFGQTMGDYGFSLWSAGANNVLDYDVLENAYLGNGILMASHEGLVSRNLIKNNHMLGEIRLGATDQAGEQDKVIDGNRIYTYDHSIVLYYQRQATIQNNVLVKSYAQDGVIDDYIPLAAQNNIWLGNQYHNLNGLPFYRSDDSYCTWEEWVQATGETGDYFMNLPANVNFIYPDRYTAGMSLVCEWNYSQSPVLVATRVQA